MVTAYEKWKFALCSLQADKRQKRTNTGHEQYGKANKAQKRTEGMSETQAKSICFVFALYEKADFGSEQRERARMCLAVDFWK